MKRLFTIMTTVAVLLAGCKKEDSGVVQSIKFTNVDSKRLTLVEGETFRVKYTVEPEELLETAVLEWTSSDEEVASVKNGRVKALCPGRAEVTASCGKATASFNIEVVPIEVTAFELQSSASGFVGKDIPIEVTGIEPSDASAASIKWSVDPEGLAYVSVSEGQLYLTGYKPGKGVLIGEGVGVTKQCSLELLEYISVENLSLTPAGPIELGYSESITIKGVVSPSDASIPEVNWEVNAPKNLFSDVTISGAILKLTAGSEEGQATIIASADGKSVSTRVTVKRPPVNGIAVYDFEKHLSLPDGQYGNPSSFQILAETRPEGTDAEITYASTDPSVATVSADGIVTAKSHGVTYITMSAENHTSYQPVYVINPNAISWVVEYWDSDNQSWESGSGTKHSSNGYFRFRAYDSKSKVKDPDGNEKIHFDFIQVNWLYDTWVDTHYNKLPTKLQWAMEDTEDYEFRFKVKSGETYTGSVTLYFTYGNNNVVIGPPVTVYVSNKELDEHIIK